MLAAVHQIRWLTDTPIDIIRIDPVRMAHSILTGIGFLGAGVTFREGFTIRGLTTAASLWITSSLGILFGVGFYALAIVGTVATVLVLAAVRFTEARLAAEGVRRHHPEAAARSRRHYRRLLADQNLAAGPVTSALRNRPSCSAPR